MEVRIRAMHAHVLGCTRVVLSSQLQEAPCRARSMSIWSHCSRGILPGCGVLLDGAAL